MASLRGHLLVSPDPATRAYRLIDSFLQPHPHLDGLYESIEEAIRDAISWLEGLEPDAGQASIGLEVSTNNGAGAPSANRCSCSALGPWQPETLDLRMSEVTQCHPSVQSITAEADAGRGLAHL